MSPLLYNQNMLIIKEMIQKIQRFSSRHVLILDILFLLFIVIYVLAGVPTTPFHGDESTYINISQDYDSVFKKRDFGRVLFNLEGNSKQYIRLTTGSILAYSIGFVRDVTNNEDPITKWLWGASWDENIKLGNMPVPRLLNLARNCSAVMGALGMVVFFFTALKISASHLVAWVATLILTTHGDVLLNIRRAMQEGPKFLFIILTIYIASVVIKKLNRINTNRYLYVLLGIASGVALAAKQDIAPMLVAIYLALVLIPIWRKETRQIIFVNIFYLALATVLAFACFLILMPVFWGWWESAFTLIALVTVLFQFFTWRINASSKVLALLGCVLAVGLTVKEPNQWNSLLNPLTSMMQIREETINNQLKLIQNHALDLSNTQNKVDFFLNTVFTSRTMYTEVASFEVPPFYEQVTIYEDSFLSGRIGPSWMDGLIFLFMVFGCWYLLKPFKAESIFIFSLFLISAMLLYTLIPLPWQRYFIIMQIPYSLIAAAGVQYIYEAISKDKKTAS